MSLMNKFMAVLLLTATGAIWANKVIPVENLVTVKQIANEKGKVILLMFSASDCPFCVIMENDFLNPMLINPEKTEAIIYKIEIDQPGNIVDFNGEKISPRDFANKHRVHVTPTLLFFDATGHEKANRIIGTMTKDYLSYYIDKRIEIAKHAMSTVPKSTFIK